MLEKQLSGHRVDRAICAWFWEQAIAQGDSFKVLDIAMNIHLLIYFCSEFWEFTLWAYSS